MADSILTSVVSIVKIGSIKIEGLLLSNGEYAVASTQINSLISFSTSNNTISRDLKRLLGEGFSPSKVKIDISKQLINCVSLTDFEKILFETAIAGNKKATELSRTLVGLSLRQLFADSFGEKFEKEERQNWLKTRMAGKVTRRGLTDAIKDWYERNPGGTTRPYHAMFSHTTNLIYKALWDMDAVQLEKHLGCGRHEAREFMDEKSLKLLDRAEGNVMDFIDEDNLKPVDAVPLANIRKAKSLPLKDI